MNMFLTRDRGRAVGAFLLLSALILMARVWLGNLDIGGNVRLDVAIIALALASIRRGATFGMTAGFLIGLMLDAPLPAWMGASSVGFVIVGFFSGSFGQTIYVDKMAARGLLVFGSVLMFDLFFGLLTFGVAQPFFGHLFSSFASAVLTGTAALIIAWLGGFFAPSERTAGDLVSDG